jgi:hypothetical protein
MMMASNWVGLGMAGLYPTLAPTVVGAAVGDRRQMRYNLGMAEREVAASCLCGAVRFQVRTSEASAMEHCHCGMCRKAHGASFVTWIDVPRAALRLERGADLLRRYRSSADAERIFCGECGASLLWQRDGADQVSLAAGILDGDPGCRPAAHIYVGSRAAWVEPGAPDQLPQYAAGRSQVALGEHGRAS